MPLDLVILGSDGAPTRSVSIGTGAHQRLISVAGLNRAELTLRMKDFYADTDYESAELPQLLAELDILSAAAKEDDELARTLASARGLVKRALQAGCGISVISD